jgi:hypothetical protein
VITVPFGKSRPSAALVGGARRRAVRIDADEAGAALGLAAVAVETEIADEGATLAVDHHVVARAAGKRAELGDDGERAPREAQQPPVEH